MNQKRYTASTRAKVQLSHTQSRLLSTNTASRLETDQSTPALTSAKTTSRTPPNHPPFEQQTKQAYPTAHTSQKPKLPSKSLESRNSQFLQSLFPTQNEAPIEPNTKQCKKSLSKYKKAI
jgi:hypothetical protein